MSKDLLQTKLARNKTGLSRPAARRAAAAARFTRRDMLESLEDRVLLSTYYVSPSGSDSAAGGSSSPWKSLQKAADSAKAGDIVHVGAGTYNAGMNFFGKTGGTASAPIQFLADPGAVLTHAATVGTNASLAGINVESTGGYYTFKGFTINSDGSMQRGGIRIAGSSNVQVLNNTIDGAFIGIFASNADNLLIQGNTARNSTDQHGIYVSLNTHNAVIRGNTIYGNNWDGLHMNALNGSPNDGALVEDNVIYGNNLAGMDIEGVTHATFRNNVIYSNGKHGITIHSQDQADTPVAANDTWVNNTIANNGMFGIQIQSPDTQGQVLFNNVLISNNTTYGAIGTSGNPSGLTSDYNVVSDNFSTSLGSSQMSLAQWQSNTGQDKHSIVATPSTVFVNAGSNDYHLKSGSPAIDKGTASLAGRTAPTADFAGAARPQGAGYDVGAYEYASGTGSDTTPPVISGTGTSNVTSGAATVNWTTNEASDTQVEYGTSTSYGSSTTLNTSKVTSHSAALSGLTAGTLYHYRVKSRDAAGNLATSGDFTFTTAAGADTTPPVISAVGTSNVTGSGARVNWTTNEGSDTEVEYGTTTSYGNSTGLDPTLVTSHSATLSGLAAGTTYHYHVLSRDAAGNLATSSDFTFTTALGQGSSTVFSSTNLGDFANYSPLTASRWSVAQDGGDTRLYLNTGSYDELSGDRLGEYALAGGQSYADFDLTLNARTGEDLATNKMADYAIVFGYTDANNYSYAMLNTDASSSAIFDVVNGVRQQVATSSTSAFTDAAYHAVQVSRRGQVVTVSVDGRQLLSANDAGMATPGQVGVGSFNDSAYFDDVNATVPVPQSPTAFSAVPVYGDFANYTALTDSRWSVARNGGDTRLYLNTGSYDELSGDRLGEYALAGTQSFGDFDFTMNAKSAETLSSNGQADYAVVFGYTDANNYSYVMLNSDATSSAIFDVVNGVRQQVAVASTSAFTDNAYHAIEVSRSGRVVTVSVDGRQLLSASSAGLATVGQVGVGSFNDSAYFDDINVTAAPQAAATPAASSPFSTSRVTRNSVLA